MVDRRWLGAGAVPRVAHSSVTQTLMSACYDVTCLRCFAVCPPGEVFEARDGRLTRVAAECVPSLDAHSLWCLSDFRGPMGD